jgi:Na+-driven multidrug efflux pump
MTFRALLTIKAVVCLLFGPILLFVPAALLKFLGSSLESGGTFTAREYGAALIGGLVLTLFARDTTAIDARRAILLYLFVYDAIGFGVTLAAVASRVLNSFGLGIAFVYLFFTLGSAYLLLRRRVTEGTGA